MLVADNLKLVERWSSVGHVVQVGAVAYDLVVTRDIDYEVFTSGEPTISDGFKVLAELAEHPRVTKARFWNALGKPDQGLYWQVRCLDDQGQEWKVDLWTLSDNHPGPCAAWIVEPMKQALTNELRLAILLLKEARAAGLTREVASIDLYRAVIEGGARTPASLDSWLGPNYSPSLTAWRPSTRN
jgi:hypothetical protein